MTTGKWLLPLLLIVLLSPSAVMADELWIHNEGGLEVVIECDGGATVAADSGICVINPDYGEGTAKVAAADITAGWVCITADNITSWDIEIACGQDFLDVVPKVRLVKDVVEMPATSNPDDGGTSIADMNREKALTAREPIDRWMDSLPF